MNFSATVLSWFTQNSRPLPWRLTYTLYHIWISEIMLQQTQMSRAVEYFARWTQRFPDISSLAHADEEEVLKLWGGLGYYSRARNILKSARILVSSHDGKLPEDHKTLLQLPGIGPYTAAAIMSLAFKQDYPVVDANVERLFARYFDIDTPVKNKEAARFIKRKAKELLPPGKAREHNQGVMELGALVCTPASPNCTKCPLSYTCGALRNDTVTHRPVSLPKTPPINIEMACGILISNQKILIQQRPETGVWAGLWEFPGGRVEDKETPAEAVIREFQEETELAVEITSAAPTVKHSYMHYKVTLSAFFCSMTPPRQQLILHAAQRYKWVSFEELTQYAFPAGHRKIIAALTEAGVPPPDK